MEAACVNVDCGMNKCDCRQIGLFLVKAASLGAQRVSLSADLWDLIPPIPWSFLSSSGNLHPRWDPEQVPEPPEPALNVEEEHFQLLPACSRFPQLSCRFEGFGSSLHPNGPAQ